MAESGTERVDDVAFIFSGTPSPTTPLATPVSRAQSAAATCSDSLPYDEDYQLTYGAVLCWTMFPSV